MKRRRGSGPRGLLRLVGSFPFLFLFPSPLHPIPSHPQHPVHPATNQTPLTQPTGLPKAQYALGYFTEMGIGCRRDPLEANVWYVRAADQGDDRARIRIAAIRAAASGEGAQAGKGRGGGAVLRDVEGERANGGGDGAGGEEKEREKKSRKWGIF